MCLNRIWNRRWRWRIQDYYFIKRWFDWGPMRKWAGEANQWMIANVKLKRKNFVSFIFLVHSSLRLVFPVWLFFFFIIYRIVLHCFVFTHNLPASARIHSHLKELGVALIGRRAVVVLQELSQQRHALVHFLDGVDPLGHFLLPLLILQRCEGGERPSETGAASWRKERSRAENRWEDERNSGGQGGVASLDNPAESLFQWHTISPEASRLPSSFGSCLCWERRSQVAGAFVWRKKTHSRTMQVYLLDHLLDEFVGGLEVLGVRAVQQPGQHLVEWSELLSIWPGLFIS